MKAPRSVTRSRGQLLTQAIARRRDEATATSRAASREASRKKVASTIELTSTRGEEEGEEDSRAGTREAVTEEVDERVEKGDREKEGGGDAERDEEGVPDCELLGVLV